MKFPLVAAPLLLISVSALAQMPGAGIVKASAVSQSPTVKRGSTGILKISLQISPGFHVNAPKPNDPSLIPTTFTATAAAGVTFGPARFAPAKTIQVSYSKTPMLVYQNQTTILVPFTAAKTARPGKVSLSGQINYQGCNATSCFPPASAPVHASVTLK